jgi:uncharacterized glyoxalase superfamily protein PhnB
MLSNRSIPRATVIPVLAYPDVNQAAAWLCDAFGFSVRLRIGNHRVQLNVGDGAVIVREMRPNEVNAALGMGHSVIIRVEDADAHCNRAKDHGARITQEPVTHPYGERQYTRMTSRDTRGPFRSRWRMCIRRSGAGRRTLTSRSFGSLHSLRRFNRHIIRHNLNGGMAMTG